MNIWRDGRHNYFVDDRFVTSVTRALRLAGVSGPPRVAPSAAAQWAMDRGSAVHAATEYDDDGTLDEASVDPAAASHVCAWRRFKRESGIIIEAREQMFYCVELDYAGQLDCKCNIAGKNGILDIKTGQRYRWHAIQTAGYAWPFGKERAGRWSLNVNPRADGKPCEHPFCNLLPPHVEGDYKLYEYTDVADFDVWRAALIVGKAEQNLIAPSKAEAARRVVAAWLENGIERAQ